MTTEERADQIAAQVMASYGLKGKKIREAVADAAQIGLEDGDPVIERPRTEGPCRETIPGTVPSWAGEDQIDPCRCALPIGHEGRCKCSHDIAKEGTNG